jgi:AcrR family transcriptional regulator
MLVTVEETPVTRAERSTRDRLVRAARDLADELPLDRLYAGVTTAAVAERAGVTTGSFFHHFRNAEQFADAVARSFLEEPHDQTETVDDMLDALEHDDLVAVLRATLSDIWQVMSTDPLMGELFRGQMHLFAHHGLALRDATATLPDVAAVLRTTYRVRQADAASGWEYLLDQTGLMLVEPFTTDRIATALTALLQGLQLRHAVDPEVVDDELYSDVATLLAGAIAQPKGRRRLVVADVAGALGAGADLSPQARSGARRRRESRRRITEAATGMFGSGWEEVTATEVAERADVSTQTVINLFGSVRSVAASTFGLHVPAIRSAIEERVATDPLLAVHAGLRELAVSAAEDPEPARALLSERVAAILHHGADLGDSDVRVLVPVAFHVLTALQQLDLEGLDAPDLVADVVNFTLSHAIPRRGRSEETAELALRLLPAAAREGRRAEGPPPPLAFGVPDDATR